MQEKLYYLSSSELAITSKLTLGQLIVFHTIVDSCMDRTQPLEESLDSLGDKAGMVKSTVHTHINALCRHNLVKRVYYSHRPSLALAGLKKPSMAIPSELLDMLNRSWLEIGCYLWLLGSGQCSLGNDVKCPLEKLVDLNPRFGRDSIADSLYYLLESGAVTGSLTIMLASPPLRALAKLRDDVCVSVFKPKDSFSEPPLFGQDAAIY